MKYTRSVALCFIAGVGSPAWHVGSGVLLALVRLGVANVRWACAAPRLATHRKQMTIAANDWLYAT